MKSTRDPSRPSKINQHYDIKRFLSIHLLFFSDPPKPVADIDITQFFIFSRFGLVPKLQLGNPFS
ncbi:MAG: hypothetical protein D3922_07815 [Candidatus Electrothrix sp. AR1]|nr:hypothetical protein [Candidatus Electrothrix sp. AR1]